MTELRATDLRLAPGSVDAASEHIAVLIPRLELTRRQLDDVQRRVGALLGSMSNSPLPDDPDTEGKRREHRDVEILLSIPGIGRINAATMLAQASRAIAD